MSMNSPFGAPSNPTSSPPPSKEMKMASAEQLVLDLSNHDLRENALLELSKCVKIRVSIVTRELRKSPNLGMAVISIGRKVITLVSTRLLRECKTLKLAMLLHQQTLVRGLEKICVYELVGAYIGSGKGRSSALTLLEALEPARVSVFWWNELIRGLIRSGFSIEALGFYTRMKRLGWIPDEHTFPFVLKASGELSELRFGASVHGSICKTGFRDNVFVCNALITMYGRCGELEDARKLFEGMFGLGKCDVVTWNSIVAAYSQNGDSESSLEVFGRMTREITVRPNAFSIVNVLSACGSLNASKLGKEVHGFSIRYGLCEDLFVGNAIVDMYSKSDMMDEAKKAFERMVIKDVVTWNIMVTGYSRVGRFEDAIDLFKKMRTREIEMNVVTWSSVIAGFAQKGFGFEALDVFRKMRASGYDPNPVTLVSLLSGCASARALLQGKETHCYAVKRILRLDERDLEGDLMIINGLIDMYSKCKQLRTAKMIFDSIGVTERHVVTWTTMIGGYAQNGEANDALSLFSQMVGPCSSRKPNAFTISCVLMACAHLGALRFGKEIHSYVIRNGYESKTPFVSNCLIDMYAKSGDVDLARSVFDKTKQRNFVSWTSLLAGYGMHGRGKEALGVFKELTRAGSLVDGVTFVVLLYACSHSGLIDEGLRFFHEMKNCYGVTPDVDHYACMVDLLGRSGRLNKALKLIEAMPMKPSSVVWYSLLGCCRLHGNVEIGEYAAKRVSELGSENDGSYTLLSNIYAKAKRWKDVAEIRSRMKHTGVRKRPGCSWVQGKEGTTTFFVGDRAHPRSREIYEELARLIERIKDVGYVSDTSFALHDVGEEEKGDLLFEHSEKLALAYAILTTPIGSPIRITKNLRVCGDCHSAFTHISKIVDHEIILRDSSRFHHFKNGSCSCRGFW